MALHYKVEEGSSHWAGLLAKKGNLHRRHDDATLVILCTGLLITTNITVEWLNSLIFHDHIHSNLLQLMDR